MEYTKYKIYIHIFIIIIILVLFTFIFVKRILITDLYHPIDKDHKIIYFGQTLDLENNDISIDYSRGFQLAFQSVNRLGGINGYKLKIILYNDKYESSIALTNAKLLIDYYNVLALIGPFGTPTTIEILNECIKGRPIPLIGPYSSSPIIRKMFNKYLILLLGSAKLELEIITKNMIKNKVTNISIIYQNDSYGIATYTALIQYILKNNLNINIISTGKYERNSVDLENTYKTLFNVKDPFNYDEYKNSTTLNQIQSVLIISSEKQIPYILAELKRIKPSLYLYYTFFAGTNTSNYAYLDNYNSDNIYQTLLGPYNDMQSKYPDLYKKLQEETNYFQTTHPLLPKIVDTQSLYQGFYTGLLIVDVLKKFDNFENLDRETFINMFYNTQNFDISGLKIGPFIENKSNTGINYVSLNKIQNKSLSFIESS
jgi:hypothetical protein